MALASAAKTEPAAVVVVVGVVAAVAEEASVVAAGLVDSVDTVGGIAAASESAVAVRPHKSGL